MIMYQNKKILIAILLLFGILLQVNLSKANSLKSNQTSKDLREFKGGAPALAELFPRAIDLSEQVVKLEKTLMAITNLSRVKDNIDQIQKNIDEIKAQYEMLRKSRTQFEKQFINIRSNLEIETAKFFNIIQGLSETIAELEMLKKFWINEQQQWDSWQTFIPESEHQSINVEPLFIAASASYTKALELISKRLKQSIEVQYRAIDTQTKISTLSLDIAQTRFKLQAGKLNYIVPPILSSRYLKQYDRQLLHEIEFGFKSITIPGLKFVQQEIWVITSQMLFALFLVFVIFRHRSRIEQLQQVHFYAKRPFSVAFFVSTTILAPFYISTDPFLNLAITITIGFSAARLVGGFIRSKWAIRFFYGLAILVVSTLLLPFLGMPLPLIRLYVFSAAVFALVSIVRHIFSIFREEGSKQYKWFLGLIALILCIIIISVFVGYSDLGIHLFSSLIETIYLGLVAWMLMMIAQGFIELIVRSHTLQKIDFLRTNTSVLINHIVLIVRLVIGFAMVSYILQTWLRAKSALAVMQMIFSLGITIDTFQLTIGLFVSVVACFYGSIAISYTVQALLNETAFTKQKFEHGVKVSIFKIIHYAFLFIGFLLALNVLGVEMKSITIIGGALSVGIGFGLQGIVRNFISGIILLFERPIKVGDHITIDNQWGKIKNLGLRSAVVQTLDRSEIVIPNEELISKNVTNWTLSDRFMRITIAVGVVYGSDIETVKRILDDCAKASPKVTRMPQPQVLFLNFGESSLDFELRVWVSNIDDRFFVTDFLHEEIDKRFREAGVSIAFPQRSLHIRTTELPGNVKSDNSE